jgi:hypothetical protein
LKLPLLEQEKRLFTLLCQDSDYKEFYNRHLQSSLNSFPSFGSAIGVMPLLDLPKVRRFLFTLLAELEIGRWYTTASLIRYLQEKHPYFLIPPPEKLPQKDKWNRPLRLQRYDNFYEYTKETYYHDRSPIADNDPDGFRRVEGRFVERFLEGIPLTLGYTDVAYSPQPYEGRMPEMGTLQAFRLNGRFHQVMHATAITPNVTVLPTFEIHVESPVRLIRQPDDAFHTLEQAERVPLSIRHDDNRFMPLFPPARTRFPKQKEARQPAKQKSKPALTLQRETYVRLSAPSAETYEQLRAALLEQRCLFTADPPHYAITYARSYQPQVDAALAALRQRYTIQIDEKAP